MVHRAHRIQIKVLGLLPGLILILAMIGCGGPTAGVRNRLNREAKATGSPFRWESESRGGNAIITRVLLDLPRGDTKADAPLKKDILSKIERVESSKGRGAPEIAEICLMPDGREVWVLKNQQHGVAYVIRMEPAPQGGTDFTVAGPEHFRRKPNQ